jgi:hypothetical protein
MKRELAYPWILGLVFAVGLVLVSPFASPSPDGLERVAEDTGFIDEAQDSPYEVMPDYTIRGIGGGASTIAAGIAGVVVVFALVYGISYVLRRRRAVDDSAAGTPDESGRQSGDGSGVG